VTAQIAVLMALTQRLFDSVALEQMTVAERALREAAATIPSPLCARLETTATFSDEDRKTILELAQLALAPFQVPPKVATAVRNDS